MAKDFNEVWHKFCREDSEISIRFQYKEDSSMNEREAITTSSAVQTLGELLLLCAIVFAAVLIACTL